MNKKILSAVFIIFGIGVFIWGSYVANESTLVEQKISQAEENQQEQRRPRFGPVRRSARAEAAENAQEKIGTAEQKVGKAQATANWLHGTGIALFVVGVGCLMFSFSHKKRD